MAASVLQVIYHKQELNVLRREPESTLIFDASQLNKHLTGSASTWNSNLNHNRPWERKSTLIRMRGNHTPERGKQANWEIEISTINIYVFKDQITVLFYFYFKPLKFQKLVKFGCKIYFSIKKVNNFTIQKFGNQKIPDWFHLSPEELKKKKVKRRRDRFTWHNCQ